MPATIQGLYAREIIDSRGVPTIECSLWLDNGAIVATSVPTGTSVGKYEAHELRDNDSERMNGKGVLKAVEFINTTIAQSVIGKDPTQQFELDQLLVDLDGTSDKSKIGSNSILAVSQAILKAGALSINVPLYYYIQQKYQLTAQLAMPSCIYTMINGGSHGADNLDIQEFELIPASHIDYETSLNIAVTLYHKIEEVLTLKGAIHSTGIVGGFTPNLYSNTDVFEILVETIKASPYTFAQDVFFGIDVAASELYTGGKYALKDRSEPYTAKEMITYYKKLRDLYHVFYIEDPFQEDDIGSWQDITRELGETTKIVGDSFLVTNKDKTAQAITDQSCNAVLVKPNQTGTISETVEVIRLAREANWQVIISHRSGETNDDFIADFAVGVGADYTKFGPPARGERVAKYNRMLQIHQEILHNQGTSTKESTALTPEEVEAAQAVETKQTEKAEQTTMTASDDATSTDSEAFSQDKITPPSTPAEVTPSVELPPIPDAPLAPSKQGETT
ncbi:MAG: phosphopyruvate hydratase [Pseudomonadales bacterium]|nr:phosphopyruvate hydratase [Pseudomonadales bacterium]